MSTDHRIDAEQLWCLGYQYMIDSRRVGQQPRERAEDAQQAALLFAASQTRVLVQVAERLAEIAEQLRISNAMSGGLPVTEGE